MSDELRVGGMVDRLDAHDPGLESGIALLHVPEEVQFCLRWAHDEDVGFPLQTTRDLIEEPVLVVGMIPDSHFLFLGMAMNVRAWSGDYRLVYRVAIDFEDTCFLGINPNYRVLHEGPPFGSVRLPSVFKRKSRANPGDAR